MGVPSELAARIRPYLGESAQEITEQIQREIPEFARPPESSLGRRLHRGVERAIHHFWDQIEDPHAPRESLVDLYRDIGRAELKEGRSLDTLQSALRIGGRVALRFLVDNNELFEIPPQTLFHVADAIFRHLDELASASAEGYAEAQTRHVEEQERRRRQLLQLLLTAPQPDPNTIASQARAAGWQLPHTAAAVAVAGNGDKELSARGLPPDVLVDLNWLDARLVIPDPDGPGRPQTIEAALSGWVAAIGPTVPLDALPMSLCRARQALKLGQRGIIDTSSPIRCSEHMATLFVFSDEELVDSLVQTRLAPLRELRPAQQDRLAETLLAWLQYSRNANEVASHLYVHPQTVRYRLRQLEELFGDQLHTPDQRFELEIALRARQLRR
ncbi:PucR family transcriptional regulator [Salinactinospora qingdaonensis]|uniref:Helix-turn-helix domain-containing protein n=1 Tax=Salinactinospora qingdaonensis TaxID=702744 RepID=A0ABP7GDE9_9ACTN